MRFPEAREGSREKSLDISADWGRLPQQPEGLVFALPVSVQVAVSIYCFYLIAIADSEAYFRCCACCKGFSLVALLSLQ